MMKRIRNLCFTASLLLALSILPAHAEDTVRAEVGTPLQAAQELAKAKNYKEALAKIAEADAVAGKTPNESFLIARMRGALAMQAGDTELALKSFEAVIAAGKLPPTEQLQTIQAVAGLAYRAKDYAKAAALAARYFKEGGSDGKTRTLLVQADYLSGNYDEAAKLLREIVAEEERANRPPDEEQLRLLASCYIKKSDLIGYASVLEKMVAYHPKKEYWADLLQRLVQRPGFSNRLALDFLRLKRATGNLKTAGEFIDLAQLALQAGVPVEAQAVLQQGFAEGVLGDGADAVRHKGLRELAAKNVAEEQASLAHNKGEIAAGKAAATGTGLFNLGYALVQHGQLDQGFALMEEGLRKGSLKRTEEAKLHLGIAYLQAGRKAKATQLLENVQGTDGLADLARYWLLTAPRS